jgi:phosphatidylglycerol:prolipoprotein diacylglycerol transferase
MLILFIVLAVVGVALIALTEIANRPQGATLKARFGARADLILNILGTVGMLLFLVGLGGALLRQYVPGLDMSQGIQFTERESLLLWGALQVRYYGIIIVIAMLLAANVSARLAMIDGRNPEHIWGALTWAIIPGIILARLWFVTFPPITSNLTAADYYANFFDVNNGAIAIWSGGLSIFGAVLGGFAGAYIYFYRNGLVVPAWLDIAAVGLPLGQAVGRWANYINQELYGSVTNLPWGIQIEMSRRVFPFTSPIDYPFETTLFHPLFLYESIWSFLAFILLLNLFLRNRNKMRPGNIFLLYLMQYSVIRFLLEFLRLEISVVGGLNFSQVVTGVIFVVAAVLFFVRSRATDATPRKKLKDRPMASEIKDEAQPA